MNKFNVLLSALVLLCVVDLSSQEEVEYAFSYPSITPVSQLDPTSPQLDPNKIHLVILGDGYHVYDYNDDTQTYAPTMDYSTPFETSGVPILNYFFNKEIISNYSGLIPYSQNVTLYNDLEVCGDSEDVLDYIFGYEGVQPRPG
jgi:hypothetical protein